MEPVSEQPQDRDRHQDCQEPDLGDHGPKLAVGCCGRVTRCNHRSGTAGTRAGGLGKRNRCTHAHVRSYMTEDPPAVTARYGPNSARIERFLARLRGLSLTEWEQVSDLGRRLDREATRDAAWAAAQAARRHPRWLHVVSAVDQVPAPPAASVAVRLALLALLVLDLLPPRHSAILYAPFAAAIPLEELDPSRAA